MKKEATPPASFSWKEIFRQTHDLSKIPEACLVPFKEIIEERAALREYYATFPKAKFGRVLGKGDSARAELIHQIEHTLLRIEGLQTGKIDKWNYAEIYPDKHDALSKKSQLELVQQFDVTTEELYAILAQPENLKPQIQMPPFIAIKLPRYNSTPTQLLSGIAYHDTLHLGMLVKLADAYHLPRPVAMRARWG